jgi:hypothetical protein
MQPMERTQAAPAARHGNVNTIDLKAFRPNMDRAVEEFRKGHPDITRQEALKMFRDAGA